MGSPVVSKEQPPYVLAAMTNPLAYSIEAAAAKISLSPRTLQNRIADGAITARRDGGRTVILHSDLLIYLSKLPVGTADFKSKGINDGR